MAIGSGFYLLCAAVPSTSKVHFFFHTTPLCKSDYVHNLEETKELIDHIICVGMVSEVRAKQG